MYDPMPEVTEIDYLATFELLFGEDTEVTSTVEQDKQFLEKLANRLGEIFPEAAIDVRLDGAQYATRGSRFYVPDYGYDDRKWEDLSWYEYVCDQIAQDVANEVYSQIEAA